MADLTYCPILIGAPCLAPEVWAAWAQAVLSAAAIYFAALAATAPERLAKIRKAKSYLALLSIADEMLTFCVEQRPNIIAVSRLKQLTGQFAEVNVENVPDYRMLKPMQETHSSLAVLLDVIETRQSFRDRKDLAGPDGLIKEMSTGYRDLLRVRMRDVAKLVDEIAPQNWFTRMAERLQGK